MKEHTSELFFDSKSILSEGPGYHPEKNKILWVDIEAGIINELDFDTKINKQILLGGKVGFAVYDANSSIVAGAQNGFIRVDPQTGGLTNIGNPEESFEDNRFNDGKAGPDGNIWAGTMSVHETPKAGSFYKLDSQNLDIQKQFGDVTISNGLAWDLEANIFYYIDTPTMSIDAFDFDLDNSQISNRRTVVKIPDGVGYPDGMTIDDEGNLWVAMWAGWGVLKFNPKTGHLVEKVSVPVECVSACCFAGPERDALVITSSSRDLKPGQELEQPHAGSLFVAYPGAKGPSANIFAG